MKLDETLRRNLDGIKRMVLERDDDWLILVEGREGSGKSTLALQVAQYLDPNFSEKNLIFDFKKFEKMIKTSKPGTVLLIDEGSILFFSRDAMKGENREAIRLLTLCRSLNLFIIICIPSVQIVDKYIRQYRAGSLLQVRKRGRFGFYSGNRIKKIRYNTFKNKWIYPKPNFVGSFGMVEKNLWQLYLRRKKYAITRREEKAGAMLSMNQAAKYAKCSVTVIKDRLNKGILTGEKHTNKILIEKIKLREAIKQHLI